MILTKQLCEQQYLRLCLTGREEASHFAKLKGFSIAKLHSYGEALRGCGPVDPSVFTAYGLWDYMCVNHDQYY